jgi:hypothetical protein
MKHIYSLFLLLFIAMPASELKATHYMGGEITWECLSNGKYRFTLKLYRECYITNGSAAANFTQTETMQTTVPGYPSIIMTRLPGYPIDLSPQCYANPTFPHISCTGMVPPGNANMGALQEHIYTSDASYPNGVPLSGVPPATGWMFSHSSCCRNPCTNIPGSNGMNWYLRAIMYSYNGQNASTCFDNSPQFIEKPSTVICTGYPYTYQHWAVDPEQDSLVYSWSQPWTGNNQPINTWSPGYTWQQPLPGTSQNPSNEPADLDSSSGDLKFKSFTPGAFVTVIKVTAYKCGIKVAEVFREIQVVLLNCGNNNPPALTPPFMDPFGMFTLFSSDVYAGTTVSIPVSATDFEFHPNSGLQTIKMYFSGTSFGTNFNNPNSGCLVPPCATVNPPPPVTGQFGAITNIFWTVDCQHLKAPAGCGDSTNQHVFYVKVMDDYCPAPAIAFARITLNVKDKPVLDPPAKYCLEVLPNGDVSMNWSSASDPLSSFSAYRLYKSSYPWGPYSVHADIGTSIHHTSYIHQGANAHLQPAYYYLKVKSDGCDSLILGPPGKIISTLFLENTVDTLTGIAIFRWNKTQTGLANPTYNVFRECPPANPILIAQTSDTFFIEPLACPTAFYHVTFLDILGYDSLGTPLNCQWVSNRSLAGISGIDEAYLQQISVFPNPANGQFTIDVPEDLLGANLQFELQDVSGRILWQSGPLQASSIDVHCGMNAAGVYYLRIPGRSWSKSIVIIK